MFLAVIIEEDRMRGEGGVAHGATLERGTGGTTTAAEVEGGGTGGGEEEGETEDVVDHHLRPGIEVKGHQRGTDDQRPLQCTSKSVH